MRFVDTNILLYRISTDPGELAKRQVAQELLGQDDLALSVQVLQEFYVQATRPSRPDALLHEEAAALIRSWKRFSVQAITVELVEAALAAKDRWQLSYWDAAIVEAARSSDCDILMTD